ncbi:MAG: NUDIX domain-containing protein [Oscillibacter sp.]|nr:NUDIX domain-containing protein [Oscillibacter sp.]
MARELWDAYDREGSPLGFDLVRGEPLPEGVYHLVVEVLSVTHDGRVLITRRHPDKAWGGCWEYTGGSVVKGETPVQGALRELREETGIIVSTQDLHPVYVDVWPRMKGMDADIYHSFVVFFDPSEQTIRLQEGETVDYDLLPYEDFKRFLMEDRFVDVVRVRFLDYQTDFDRIMTEHFK